MGRVLISFPGGPVVKNLPANAKETGFRSLGREDSLEHKMATHSSILARKIPWTEEPLCPCGHKESDTTEQLSTHRHRV